MQRLPTWAASGGCPHLVWTLLDFTCRVRTQPRHRLVHFCCGRAPHASILLLSLTCTRPSSPFILLAAPNVAVERVLLDKLALGTGRRPTDAGPSYPYLPPPLDWEHDQAGGGEEEVDEDELLLPPPSARRLGDLW